MKTVRKLSNEASYLAVKTLVADLQLATDLLRNNPNDETYISFPERKNLLDIYDNPANANRIAVITNQLAAIRHNLSPGLGVPIGDLIKVPVAFTLGEWIAGELKNVEAFLPNMINMIVVCSSKGARRLAVPEPCFEPYTYCLSDVLSYIGYVASEVETVDTTGVHANYGEAHCASISLRAAP